MEPTRNELHCIIGRLVTRRGPNGTPVSHREIEVIQERHIGTPKWAGWDVLIRDSDMPAGPHDIDPAQSSRDIGED